MMGWVMRVGLVRGSRPGQVEAVVRDAVVAGARVERGPALVVRVGGLWSGLLSRPVAIVSRGRAARVAIVVLLLEVLGGTGGLARCTRALGGALDAQNAVDGVSGVSACVLTTIARRHDDGGGLRG